MEQKQTRKKKTTRSDNVLRHHTVSTRRAFTRLVCISDARRRHDGVESRRGAQRFPHGVFRFRYCSEARDQACAWKLVRAVGEGENRPGDSAGGVCVVDEGSARTVLAQ